MDEKYHYLKKSLKLSDPQKKDIKLNQSLKKSLIENLVHGAHFINLLLYFSKKSKFSFKQNSL